MKDHYTPMRSTTTVDCTSPRCVLTHSPPSLSSRIAAPVYAEGWARLQAPAELARRLLLPCPSGSLRMETGGAPSPRCLQLAPRRTPLVSLSGHLPVLHDRMNGRYSLAWRLQYAVTSRCERASERRRPVEAA